VLILCVLQLPDQLRQPDHPEKRQPEVSIPRFAE
jgi:hypothetical protein